jgi:CheY-like chemotaxis protein
VLVVDHDGYSGPLLVEALERRGMRVYLERSAERAVERIGTLRIDALVVDTSLAGSASHDILSTVRTRYGNHPTVLQTTDLQGQSDAEWTKRGAGGLFERPVSADRLAFAILEHVVDSPYERSRLLRVDTDLRARINRGSEGRVTNLGFGGAFVALTSGDMDVFDRGSEIEIEIEIDDQSPVTVRGEVIWRSARQRPSMPSGVGVRFLESDERERTRVEEFVRRRKLADLSVAQVPRRVA